VIPIDSDSDDRRSSWPDTPGWSANIEEAGAESVFQVAELCKPDNLDASGHTFDQVVDWIQPRYRSRLGGRHIDPARRARFEAHRFVLVQLPAKAMRLWPRAGRMPADWTDSHSIAELAELLRSGSVEIPKQADRLRAILSAARTPEGRHRLRANPPIALSEFHSSVRPDRADTPWTLDDGSHRALALAVVGDTELWCLAGFPVRALAPTTIYPDLSELAGRDPADRSAVADYLRSADGRRHWSKIRTVEQRSALALACLPTMAPDAYSDRYPVDPSSLLDRVDVRSRHATIARQTGLFTATDDAGRHLASLVALSEFVRTNGSAVRRQTASTEAEPPVTPADTARTVAGAIANAALTVGGVDPAERQVPSSDVVAAVHDLVRRLAGGEPVPSTDSALQSIAAGAPGEAELLRLAGQRGAPRWLAHQLARAFIVASDMAQVEHERPWTKVESYAVRSLATILQVTDAIGPGLSVEVGTALARALNRIGVAHRARWPEDGVWRTQYAALHHEAARRMLAWCPTPKPDQVAGCVLNWYTTLLNLASAWTDEVTAGTKFRLDPTDERHRRAAYLIRALNQQKADAARLALGGRTQEGGCGDADLPDWVLIKLKHNPPVAWLRSVLLNDYAEMQWCAGRHEIAGHRLSKWQADENHRVEGARDLLRLGLLSHVWALDGLRRNPAHQIPGTVAAFWYWRHRLNLRIKADELSRLGTQYVGVLDLDSVRDGLRYLIDLPDEFHGHQFATLDAYAERDHRIVLYEAYSASR